jgi:serine protease Do
VDSFSNLAVFKIDGLEQGIRAHSDVQEVHAGETVYALSASAEGIFQLVTATIRNPARVLHSKNLPIGPYIEFDKEPLIRGPIFNQRGQLVGFVVLESRPEARTQMVLAAAVSDVKSIATELHQSGKIRRSRIGIEIKRLSNELAQERALAEPSGALIAAVSKNSPAERAGLRGGDIILRFAGTVIRSPDDYMVAISRIKAGSRVSLEVLSGGLRREVTLVTGEIITGAPAGK